MKRLATFLSVLLTATLLIPDPAQADGADDMLLRYRTFIPVANTPAISPNGVCTPAGSETYRFVGDGRSWSPTTGRSRTDVTIRFNWRTKKPSITAKSVGRTYRQKKVGGVWKAESSKQATGTFTAKTNGSGKDFAIIEVAFSAKNPFCSFLSKPISSKFVMRIEKKRAAINGGSITAVPNHEIYLKRSTSSSWKTVKRVTNKGFVCLGRGVACTTASLTSNWISY